MSERIVRIGAGAGSWGDDVAEPGFMLRNADLDYLVLDYLSEITLSILRRQMDRDPAKGFAGDVLTVMRDIVPLLSAQTCKVVTNAGGLNPRACARAIEHIVQELGLSLRVALVEGDDLLADLDRLAQDEPFASLDDGRAFASIRDQVLSANAYLGAAPIRQALAAGADIVVTGRCVDVALTLGPLMFEHGWQDEDWDVLAAGMVAGHLLECGAQSSGGNAQDWRDIPGLEHVSYPIAEVACDGTIVVTKADGGGGAVTIHTVTEQLLHEIFDPAAVLSPDVTADWTSIELKEVGKDRVRVSGVRGAPPPSTLKVSMTYREGYRVILMWPYTWPHAVAKAEAALRQIEATVARLDIATDAVRGDIFGTGAILGRAAGELPPVEPIEVVARFAARLSRREDAERLAAQQAPMHYGPEGLAGSLAGGRGQLQPIYSHWPTTIDGSRVRAHVELLA